MRVTFHFGNKKGAMTACSHQSSWADEKHFSCWSDVIARAIYPTFIRPHLELASSVWNPPLKYDSNILESVQRRATLTRELSRLPYYEILERLGLADFSSKRERGDFIQIYKTVHGVEKVNWCENNKILKPNQIRTVRRHHFELSRSNIGEKTDLYQILFSIERQHLGIICQNKLHRHHQSALSRTS